ncbi:PA2169 family four-helix-bundle protein [Flavobacterium sp. CGRL2]
MIHTDETTKEAVKTLEGLISILEDGKLGYTNAAEHVENPAMKTDFLEYARERALFIVELQDEINKLGKSTDTSGGGPLGALHRAWIDIKSSLQEEIQKLSLMLALQVKKLQLKNTKWHSKKTILNTAKFQLFQNS